MTVEVRRYGAINAATVGGTPTERSSSELVVSMDDTDAAGTPLSSFEGGAVGDDIAIRSLVPKEKQ